MQAAGGWAHAERAARNFAGADGREDRNGWSLRRERIYQVGALRNDEDDEEHREAAMLQIMPRQGWGRYRVGAARDPGRNLLGIGIFDDPIDLNIDRPFVANWAETRSILTSSDLSRLSDLRRLRIDREWYFWRKDGPTEADGFRAKKKSAFQWEFEIPGPSGSLWEGGIFTLTVDFPKEYPYVPPNCRFTPISTVGGPGEVMDQVSTFFHPNVSECGSVNIEILSQRLLYKPSFTVLQIVLAIQSMLDDPNVSMGINQIARENLISDQEEYARRVAAQAACSRSQEQKKEEEQPELHRNKRLTASRHNTYSKLKSGMYKVPPDVTFCLNSSQNISVHKAIVGNECGLLGSMLTSNFSEGDPHRQLQSLPQQLQNNLIEGNATQNPIPLELPQGCTFEQIDRVFEFCYNRSIDWNSADRFNDAIGMWRLCEYLDCESLLEELREWIPRCTCDAFIAGIREAIFWGCDSAFVTYIDSVVNISDSSDVSRDGNNNTIETDKFLTSVRPDWVHSNPDELLEAFVASIMYINQCSSDAESISPSSTFRRQRLFVLAAREANARWCHLPTIASLPMKDFVTLMCHIPIGDICETVRCEIVLSYLDRNYLPFGSEEAQKLMTGAVSMGYLPLDYMRARIIPKVNLPSLEPVFTNVPMSIRPPLVCPITRQLLVEPTRLPCGHVVDRRALFRVSGSDYKCPVFPCSHQNILFTTKPTERRAIDEKAVSDVIMYKTNKMIAFDKLRDTKWCVLDDQQEQKCSGHLNDNFEEMNCEQTSKKRSYQCISTEKCFETVPTSAAVQDIECRKASSKITFPVKKYQSTHFLRFKDTLAGSEASSDFFFILPQKDSTGSFDDEGGSCLVQLDDVMRAYCTSRFPMDAAGYAKDHICVIIVTKKGECKTMPDVYSVEEYGTTSSVERFEIRMKVL